jgi:hypothetical protein
MNNLSKEDVAAIAAAVAAHQQPHACRFSDEESALVHRFAHQLQSDEAWERFQAVLRFGGQVQGLTKAGTTALVTVLVGAIVLALWHGFLSLVGSRHGG